MGDMSFVGPRPALFNQDDLIALRTEKGVHRLIPGITPVKWSLGISRGKDAGKGQSEKIIEMTDVRGRRSATARGAEPKGTAREK